MLESKYHYIIDNGHGRNTSNRQSPKWSNGRQLFEYEFNRNVVRNLTVLLDESKITYNVLVPEVRDISLGKRCKRANRISKATDKPTIFISVHGNGFKDRSVHGLETFHFPGSFKGENVARVFQANLVDELGWRDRGVKPATYKVLRSTHMPAILTESGFYTNYEQCMKMLDEGWQRRIAYAHFKSMIELEETPL